MPEHGRTVCNLRLVSLARMIFGHYSHMGLSQRTQLILKLYCIVIPPFFITIYYFLKKGMLSFLDTYDIVELLTHYSISVYTKSKYVNEYYEFKSAVDGAPGAAKMYSKMENILSWFLGLLLVEMILLCLKSYPIFDLVEIFVTVTSVSYVLLGRMPLMVIFSLLYCRANIFRKNLISTEGRPSRGVGINNHVLTYTALNESLDKTGLPPMLLLCLQILSWFINMLWLAFEASLFFKSEHHEVNYVRLLITFLIMAIDTFLVFYPAIMLELAAEEVEQSRIYIADLVVTCNDNVKRGELEELLYFLRHQPLQYKVWNAVPLTARLPLALVVLGANYLVCALQFTNTFGSNSTHVNSTEKR